MTTPRITSRYGASGDGLNHVFLTRGHGGAALLWDRNLRIADVCAEHIFDIRRGTVTDSV